ncbi:MAG: hypothetical protein IID44_04775 [Planctomycetes bacterium]|nr:hypothetical protein [Planctomycetota bacterium]
MITIFTRCVLLLPMIFGMCAVNLQAVPLRAAQSNDTARTWTDVTGKYKIEATLIDYNQGKAQLKKSNGKVVSVPLSKLSAPDRNYVRQWSKDRRKKVTKGKVEKRKAKKPDQEKSTPVNPNLDLPIGDVTKITRTHEISGSKVLGGNWKRKSAKGKQFAIVHVASEEVIKNVPFSESKCQLKDKVGNTYSCLGLYLTYGLATGVKKMSASGKKGDPYENQFVFEVPNGTRELSVLYDGKQVGKFSFKPK